MQLLSWSLISSRSCVYHHLSHALRLVDPLLGGDLAVVLDVDVLVGRKCVDLVFGERGAGQTVSLTVLGNVTLRAYGLNIREALDELELVLDLAALVGALLLGSVVC